MLTLMLMHANGNRAPTGLFIADNLAIQLHAAVRHAQLGRVPILTRQGRGGPAGEHRVIRARALRNVLTH